MKLLTGVLLLAFVEVGLGANPRLRDSDKPSQPLTYENVVRYFKAAGMRRTEVQKRCTVFFEGEWTNRDIYNYCLIIVENSDEDVQVTFYLTDAHEMNWITEFVDAPFFTKRQTQALLTLVNGHAAKEVVTTSGQRVEFHHWRPRHAEIFVFSLIPAKNR